MAKETGEGARENTRQLRKCSAFVCIFICKSFKKYFIFKLLCFNKWTIILPMGWKDFVILYVNCPHFAQTIDLIQTKNEQKCVSHIQI